MDMQSMLQKMKERANAQKGKPIKRPDRLMRSIAEESSEVQPQHETGAAPAEIQTSTALNPLTVSPTTAPDPQAMVEPKPIVNLGVNSGPESNVVTDRQINILDSESNGDPSFSNEGSTPEVIPPVVKKSISPPLVQNKKSSAKVVNKRSEVESPVEILPIEVPDSSLSDTKDNLSMMSEVEFGDSGLTVFSGSEIETFEPSSNLVQTRFNSNDDSVNNISKIVQESEPSSNLVQTRFKPSSEFIHDGNNLIDANNISLNEQNGPIAAFLSEPTVEVGFFKDTAMESEPSSNLVQTRFKNIDDSKQSLRRQKANKENQLSHNIQTRFEPSLNQVQSSNSTFAVNPINEKLGAEPGSNLVATEFKVGSQLGSKNSLHKLSPLQILILKYLHSLCEIERSDTTPPVKIFDIIGTCNCTQDGAKTAIKRMLKSEIIQRIDYKDGRGGWCQYRIPENIHSRILLDFKPGFNQVQTRFVPGSELGSEVGSSPSSKLVSNLNNNLLTKDPRNDSNLSPHYNTQQQYSTHAQMLTHQPTGSAVGNGLGNSPGNALGSGNSYSHSNSHNNNNNNYSPTMVMGNGSGNGSSGIEAPFDVSTINVGEVARFGISRKQIQDIFNQKLDFTTHTLQDFVDRFAVYASDSKNIRNVNSVPAIFVKMAQLASKGQDPLVDVETDMDRLIRERIESLKAIQEQRQRREGELIALEFENWYSGLSVEEMNNAAPPTPASKSGSSTQKIVLKSYFIENIWPLKRAEFY